MKRTSQFRQRLAGPPILADGAMGTELYARGVYVNRCYDELNRSQPELVGAIHTDYLRAGAEFITTNSYGANRFKLAPHGLAEESTELSRLSAVIARQALEKSGRAAFIAGSIGPLGRALAPLGTVPPSEAREAFAEQARGLVEGGVDFIIIETMVNIRELVEAAAAVRSVTDLPLIAQFTLTDWNENAYGATIEHLTAHLSKLDVDAVGINCSIGPNKLLEAAKVLISLTDKPVAIQPNAGELEWVEGRLICRATPEYFAEYAKRLVQVGVKIVGGCCGSTPAHIRAMEAALRAIIPELSPVRRSVIVAGEAMPGAPAAPKVHYRQLSRLAEQLDDGKFAWCVEVSPPRSPAVGRTLDRVRELAVGGVSMVNIPDGPRASARLSAMVLAHLVKRETDVEPILHYTCRDRNILGMQSDLLGAEALGLDNILCITGDPPKLGDYPMASAVFDVDAIGLLRIADNLNHGMDIVGNPIPRGTTFHLGCGVNPGAVDIEVELDRLHRKLENGARFVMTQPVFDDELFFEFLDRLNMPNIPILVGILPLASHRNAEFYHNEVPGMSVPEPIRARLKGIEDRDEAAREGVRIAAEALLRCAHRAAGAYIMPPFGRVELALGVIDQVRSDPAFASVAAGDQ